jgi:hypothetical protein
MKLVHFEITATIPDEGDHELQLKALVAAKKPLAELMAELTALGLEPKQSQNIRNKRPRVAQEEETLVTADPVIVSEVE